MTTTTRIENDSFRKGDRVHVPGRFRCLTVDSVISGLVLATFDSGFGFVTLPAREFRHGDAPLPTP